MGKDTKDYTPLEKMLAKFIGVGKQQIAQCEDSQPISRPIKTPTLKYLQSDAGVKPTSNKPMMKVGGGVQGNSIICIRLVREQRSCRFL